MFLNKLFEVTCTTMQRMAYNIRDIIRKENLPIEQICKVSIDLLLEISDIMDRVSTRVKDDTNLYEHEECNKEMMIIVMKLQNLTRCIYLCVRARYKRNTRLNLRAGGWYSKHLMFFCFFQDVAVITFQALCHVLKSYMPDMREKGCAWSEANSAPTSDHPRKLVYKSLLKGDPIVDNHILLASLLDGLAVMTEKFKLKWQECVETICVLSLAHEILKHPGILPTVTLNRLVSRERCGDKTIRVFNGAILSNPT